MQNDFKSTMFDINTNRLFRTRSERRIAVPPSRPTTRWSTTLSLKVNLHHAVELMVFWSSTPPILGENKHSHSTVRRDGFVEDLASEMRLLLAMLPDQV